MTASSKTVREAECDRMLRIWGKTSARDLGQGDRCVRHYHPLLFHMLDVAAVAGLVWDHCLGAAVRDRVASALGPDVRQLVVFCSGLHDLGKATPGFQKRKPDLACRSGLPLSENDRPANHGFVTAHVLSSLLKLPACDVLSRIAGGHHGVFPQSLDLEMGRDTLGSKPWAAARQSLLEEFASTIGLDLSRTAPAGGDVFDPALVPLLAGFISVADWIASNQSFFPCTTECGECPEMTAADYWKQSSERAKTALGCLGWLPTVTFAGEAPFDAIFAGFAPNTVQKAVIELTSRLTTAYLMIVEAPMGQGKTEAALYAADMAMCRGFARGMYVAMPTQATSNAMFQRVLDDYLRRRGHKGNLNLQLVHGDARLARPGEAGQGEITHYRPESIAGNTDAEAQSWFTANKRPLLAPFGVGTIDQSLLSVLQTRHWFVRLSGLAGKVVIFDEVHAYDAYMSTILGRLLQWLAEVGSTVILLSATLPEAKRRALVQAYSGSTDIDDTRYPRITLAQPRRYPATQTSARPECAPIATEERRQVRVKAVPTDFATMTAALAERLQDGGCAAVICNTVDRAIKVHKHLRATLESTECLLFHARTLRQWRREREEEILRKFGRGAMGADGGYINRHRPRRAVLVATQVVEQSLDLDFDLMASDIAPVDLLLQRSGRLHRHSRCRPAMLATPTLLLLCDAATTGPPPACFGTNVEHVYDRYILLRTWLTMRQRETIEIPGEIESLVEAVYGDGQSACDDEWSTALTAARTNAEHDRNKSGGAACRFLVERPMHACDLIDTFNADLSDDEDPRIHKDVRAATREGDPTMTVVMLGAGHRLCTDPEASEVRELLERSVKLSHRRLFDALLNEAEPPDEWRHDAHLRYARLLRLDENNQCRIGAFVLTVDRESGLLIEKEGECNG